MCTMFRHHCFTGNKQPTPLLPHIMRAALTLKKPVMKMARFWMKTWASSLSLKSWGMSLAGGTICASWPMKTLYSCSNWGSNSLASREATYTGGGIRNQGGWLMERPPAQAAGSQQGLEAPHCRWGDHSLGKPAQ